MAQTDVTITMTRDGTDKYWLCQYASASNGTSSWASTDEGIVKVLDQIQSDMGQGRHPLYTINRKLGGSGANHPVRKQSGTPVVG